MNVIICLASALASAAVARYYLHMLQLESYQLDGYVRWLGKNHDKHLGGTLTIGVGATVAYYALWLLLRMFISDQASRITAGVVTLVGFLAAAFLLDRRLHSQPEKKPLAYTPRMKRLYACLCLIALALAFILSALGIPAYILFVGVPYLALAAGGAMTPVEKAINNYYLNDAKAKLDARPDLIKIGITGSYGKTSTKFILAAILSEKYDVLATPASFNTPMGLTRVIREKLEPHHQVFIAEMGARHAGDIKELVDLVHPSMGLITSVGPQHLETFGNIETVANTKFELIEGLPRDGLAFFASDGGEVDKLYERAGVKKFLTGTRGMRLDMKAEDIAVGRGGSRFTLKDGATGEKIECETKLLGRHNIGNIALACCAARQLGLTLEEIARGVRKIEPVEHRLQLMPGANGVTVIDDAFNSNPVGAKAALDVLAAFEGRHVIVTPGMVEQGAQEKEINRQFGAQMAGRCDEIILVGRRRTQPIAEGLRAEGVAAERIHVVGSLDEATGVLGRIGKPGDVVLFENDLPDNYNEDQ
ncbi:MAG: UDP-N-acetylmuramoyl-tripeptide--D-alanyl-D-alanine ligase [Clostridia bacterium]|nr:UDP-N-acetylmuramoyl-tripeptide--D-alanyl-D-alanine ligase [Clostridia bacterium]